MKPHTTYLIPEDQYSYEINIQKSKFISTIRPIYSLEEMRQFYLELKTQHHKANHNCWASIAGPPTDSNNYGFSDDGEPKGTAGKPLFTVLQHSGKGHIGLIVTRYFGGVKLGTGGLVRAYTKAAKCALENGKFKPFYENTALICTFPYEQEKIFRSILDTHTIDNVTYDYADKVTVSFSIAKSEIDTLRIKVHERMGPRITVSCQ